MSTYFPSGNGLAENRKWHVVDADGKTVGHLASEVAAILSGKRNPQWTPFMDMGDHVIVKVNRQGLSSAYSLSRRSARDFSHRDVCETS